MIIKQFDYTNELLYKTEKGLPNSSVGKDSTCNEGDAGDASLIPGWGRCPGGQKCNPLHYSCLKNAMVREAEQATYSP